MTPRDFPSVDWATRPAPALHGQKRTNRDADFLREVAHIYRFVLSAKDVDRLTRIADEMGTRAS